MPPRACPTPCWLGLQELLFIHAGSAVTSETRMLRADDPTGTFVPVMERVQVRAWQGGWGAEHCGGMLSRACAWPWPVQQRACVSSNQSICALTSAGRRIPSGPKASMH